MSPASVAGAGASRRKGVRYVAVGVLLMVALTSTASAHESPGRYHRISVVSSAQPSDADPAVTDEAYRAGWTQQRDVDTDTVATASAGCDGCRGTARTVQVLDVGRARRVHADNVATAWSSCSGCGSDVVSVQVLLTRPATDLTVNNRALAVNVDCSGCDSTAAAYQVVVSTTRWVDVEALRDEVVAWVGTATAAADPGPAARKPGPQGLAPRAEAGDEDRLRDLQQLAEDATGGRVLDGAVQVRRRSALVPAPRPVR